MDLFDDKAEQQIADTLLAKTTKGESINDELNAVPYDDRLSIIQKMESKANSTGSIPDLTIGYGKLGELKTVTVEGEWNGMVTEKPFFDKEVYNAGIGSQVADARDAEIAIRAESIKNEKGQLPALELFQELVKEQKTSVSDRLGK
ncbi:MAG: hypothetical protein K2X77_33510 [Candidatus Obscuribacterales bacterium]|jgi:hypothetical protein|nr:hypothetical protein [Candidatus Obscuribacterales bacterium]